jgi:hypothetical protein
MTRKIDKIISLKARIFDLMRKLEAIQMAFQETDKAKVEALKEVRGLELKIINRYERAKKLANK